MSELTGSGLAGPGQAGSGQAGSGQAGSLAVTGGRLVLPDGVRPGGLLIRDGLIAEVLPPGARPPAARTLDAGGHYVLPGLIDSHVHFRTPGLTHKEDWACGSRAAVAGGVTCVIDMPNTVPPLFAPEDAYAKAALIAGSSLVDYAFHLGTDPEDPARLAKFTRREGTSAKVFMAGHHTAPHVMRDPARLAETFQVAADHGLLLVVHAEHGPLFDLLDGWRGQPSAWRDYEPARPRSGAIVATSRLIELSQYYGTRIHVLHVSSAEEADLLTAAKAAGIPITFEVTAHHLSFVAADISRLGARIRLSPAIRSRADQERLWQAVAREEAATLGSDHAPHSLSDKHLPVPDAPPGLPGVQELAHAVWTGMAGSVPGTPDERARLLARLLAQAPAGLFGLGARKGALRPGLDGDLVVFDPDARWALRGPDIQSKVGWSAYEGWTFTGRVLTTVRRGQVVFDRGHFGAPDGQWLEI
jgi:dihydroorotase